MLGRLLPNGWRDLARQILLFCGAYWLYRLVRGQVDGRAATAFDNARELIGIERSLGLFVEPAVHAWAEAVEPLADLASWMYVNSHFTVTVLTLAFIYLRRNESFYFVRNMFMIAMGVALLGYVAFPTAPPRFMPEWGFSDSVADFTGVTSDSASADLLFNPFAAVPSMHVAFALMLAMSMSRIVRSRPARIAWWVYPAVVSFVVVATANHWWLDAVLGALTALLSAWGARQLAGARPQVWALQPA
ncbi:MAG TPA: phosphatase PAP2 family protein [Solirubrobacteraceae bacterium]|jgi:membrane-associated phospholipid phosphatase